MWRQNPEARSQNSEVKGVPVMSVLKYPRLFEPFVIGNVVFRNRIFAAPEGFYNVGGDYLPSLDEIAFFERKAVGGFA